MEFLDKEKSEWLKRCRLYMKVHFNNFTRKDGHNVLVELYYENQDLASGGKYTHKAVMEDKSSFSHDFQTAFDVARQHAIKTMIERKHKAVSMFKDPKYFAKDRRDGCYSQEEIDQMDVLYKEQS